MKNVQVPLPPISLQQKIIAECQKIDVQAQDAKEKIAELQGEIEKIVSNVKGKKTILGNIYKISSGGTPSRKISAYWINGDIPWVTTTEVTNGIITSTNECITESGLENSSARIYPIDSLIIAMYGQGSTRGRTAKLGIEACANQACAVLYEKKIEVATDFVWYYLQSQYEKLRSISHGSVRPNLNANDIINYEIQLPSLTEQNSIVAQIGAIEDEIASLKTICDEASARKKAVLHRELIEDDEQAIKSTPAENETGKEESKIIVLPTCREGCVPLYTLRAACGYFEGGEVPEKEGWIDASGNGFTPDPKRHFAVYAKGNSMQPKIQDGDICVFEWYKAGTRNGEIVLTECSEKDLDYGGKYTIKKYQSEKHQTEAGWQHTKIELIPLNNDYDTIELDSETDYRTIGVLRCVIKKES